MKKRFKGTVVSDKMDKSVIVEVKRSWRHPLYKKVLKTGKRYLVDNRMDAKEGDKVIIEECRPLSKRKHFKIVEKI